ncbi:hypothetical protein BCR32DRAFT_86543 [Anaeromyces robustus]|uniref:SH3 domain-containing protein n=1 Tax=Anaeromyces robustus TaxID=1754192 RepID=A0A1Y1XIK4_9FUNG|nr:hypothetical protein BCR32DRAFT_86543 [Anaeromyces robustus]|eukprot:ORX85585.1 hypothetical protein BCR32DRAFT_86543 [Anaeromyces robustus]
MNYISIISFIIFILSINIVNADDFKNGTNKNKENNLFEKIKNYVTTKPGIYIAIGVCVILILILLILITCIVKKVKKGKNHVPYIEASKLDLYGKEDTNYRGVPTKDVRNSNNDGTRFNIGIPTTQSNFNSNYVMSTQSSDIPQAHMKHSTLPKIRVNDNTLNSNYSYHSYGRNNSPKTPKSNRSQNSPVSPFDNNNSPMKPNYNINNNINSNNINEDDDDDNNNYSFEKLIDKKPQPINVFDRESNPNRTSSLMGEDDINILNSYLNNHNSLNTNDEDDSFIPSYYNNDNVKIEENQQKEGKQYDIPENFKGLQTYRVVHNFSPHRSDELIVEKGHLLKVIKSYEDGWALCYNIETKVKGFIPMNKLQIEDRSPKEEESYKQK